MMIKSAVSAYNAIGLSPRAAWRPVWQARASGAIKRGANYVGRPRCAISAICRYGTRQDALITNNYV